MNNEEIEDAIDFLQMHKINLSSDMSYCVDVLIKAYRSKTHAAISSKGGKASKRKITPEQQAMMQAARKKGKAK